MIGIITSITQFLLRIHTKDLFPPPPPPPIGFHKRVHHKRILHQIHASFSPEVIHLSLNFSCGLLLIGSLIYPHPTSQKVHIFRQPGGFPRHVFITAAYLSSVIRPSTVPITEPSQKVYVFRVIDGLVFFPAS